MGTQGQISQALQSNQASSTTSQIDGGAGGIGVCVYKLVPTTFTWESRNQGALCFDRSFFRDPLGAPRLPSQASSLSTLRSEKPALLEDKTITYSEPARPLRH